jgi:hypothetical protein
MGASFDPLVIGGGPGGHLAAIGPARLGRRTADRQKISGEASPAWAPGASSPPTPMATEAVLDAARAVDGRAVHA